MRAAVLGSPIAHSLSPDLHRAAYRFLGLDWTYDAIECTREQLPNLLRGLDDSWAGLSLTMPLKAAVLPLLDDVTPGAKLVGAANTVVCRGGRLHGSNTDAPGIAATLREHGSAPVPGTVAAVLGAGATSRSALAGLAELGVDRVDVFARDPLARAELIELGSALGVAVTGYDWSTAAEGLRRPLVVSTVPAGIADHLVLPAAGPVGTLFDVLYAPWPTPLAARWTAGGGRVVGGLDLLLHQAALQVQAMTGTAASVESLVRVMRPAGVAALGAR